MIKRYLLSISLFSLFLFADAQTFLDNASGLKYNITNKDAKEVEVTYSESVSNKAQYPSLEGVITIPSQVVYDDITYTVTGIGERSFFSNKKISEVVIPSSIKSIGTYSMSGCAALKAVNFTSSLEQIGLHAFSATSLTEVNLPPSVINIGSNAFSEISSLTSFSWQPQSDAELPMNALSFDKTLESVLLGENVTKLDWNSMYNLPMLNTLTILRTVPPALDDERVFDSNLCNVTLIVPAGCISAYKTQPLWDGLQFGAYKETSVHVSVESVVLKCEKTQLVPGDRVQVTSHVLPDDAFDKTLTWSSSNSNVVTVDSNGLVTAVGEGSAIVRAQSVSDSNVSGVISFDVANVAPSETYVTLQIRTSEDGAVGLRVKKGGNVELDLLPEADYEVASVSINGEDATGSLNGYRLTLNNLNDNTVLRVVYKKSEPSVNINFASESPLKVLACDGYLRFNGISSGEVVEVFDSTGKFICKSVNDGESIYMNSGLYIIRHMKEGRVLGTFKTIL